MVTKQSIGKKIKEIRERQQLQQIDVANRLHITQSTLAKYEAGVNLPNVLTLLSLADICETCIDEFLIDVEEPNSKLTTLSADESHLAAKYRSLPQDKQRSLLNLLNLK